MPFLYYLPIQPQHNDFHINLEFLENMFFQCLNNSRVNIYTTNILGVKYYLKNGSNKA